MANVGSINGTLWTGAKSLLIHGSDPHPRLNHFTIDWASERVTLKHIGELTLTSMAAIREMEYQPSASLMASAHEDGTVLAYDWNSVSFVSPYKTPQRYRTVVTGSTTVGAAHVHLNPVQQFETRPDSFPGSLKAQSWKFASSVSSVRWCGDSNGKLLSVTLDCGEYHLIDLRAGGSSHASGSLSVASTILKAPTYAHDYIANDNELLLGDCHGILHFYDTRNLSTPMQIIKDHNQGVIGDIRYSREFGTCIIAGSPALSVWCADESSEIGLRNLGSSFVDDAIVTASHQSHATHVPGTSIIAASSFTGILGLLDI